MNQFERLFAQSGLSLERLRTFLAVAEAGNIAKAAKGDPTRQSQFSRQVKELEAYFSVSLTRRVGRRIEVTAEGHSLARLIRQHFAGLDDFRESMSGRPVAVRIGAAASVLEWMVIPKLAACREVLGEVILELEQSRSAEVVRGVADGRLDFGMVRDDAVPPGMKRWKLGRIGYALFAPVPAWKRGAGIPEIMERHPMAQLLPGGQFNDHCSEWLGSKGWRPQVLARVGSFLQIARLVRSSGFAAVLPESAVVDFDPAKVRGERITELRERPMVLLANARGIERAGIHSGAAAAMARALAWGGGGT